MIEISQLTKTYGRGERAVTALDGINLEIRSGMFGLLGPNGAGKTSLMRIVAGIARASGGSVRVGAHDLSSESGRLAAKAVLGYLPQELGMYSELTARQFVDYMAILKGLHDPGIRRSRVDEVLETVGLGPAADRKLKGFSGGMKRRVGIAQALVNDPQILIVDEPTAGLDPEERIRFRNLLVNFAAGHVVILSTHIVEDIGQTCRDIGVLARGRMLYRGSPSGLRAAAQGHVWALTAPPGERPDSACTVVSMMHLEDGIQFRLVGDGVPGAQAVAPSLEDGYVWLMRGAGQALDAN